MPRIARGARDDAGAWHPADPSDYPPMDVHGILPWSVLRQDSKPWQARKAWWVERGVFDTAATPSVAAMVSTGRHGRVSGGVSRFDPVLTELLTAWYAPSGGMILDPFAGAAVRGLVAAHLARRYTGVELSGSLAAANRRHQELWREAGILAAHAPPATWLSGAAQDLLPSMPTGSVDSVLTCPPYHNRERYSDDPADLSAMRWAGFTEAYGGIIAQAVRVLRPDRFAVWVVSDVRDHRGHLRGLPAMTTAAHLAAGAHPVAEFILIEPGGLRAKTMRPPWEACRTPTRSHQLVQVYVKGDRKAATGAIRDAGAQGAD